MRRFTQPDTLIPNAYNPQELNRYSYVNNNPLRYTDPSGHFAIAAAPVGYWIAGVAATTLSTYLSTPQGQAVTKSTLNMAVTLTNTITNAITSSVLNIGKSLDSNIGKSSVSAPTTKGQPSPQFKAPNPFERIAPLIPIADKSSKNPTARATVNEALDIGQSWLGTGYREIANGVFRSADKLRQLRMTDRDLKPVNDLPHFNLETIGEDGRNAVQNLHLYLIDMTK